MALELLLVLILFVSFPSLAFLQTFLLSWLLVSILVSDWLIPSLISEPVAFVVLVEQRGQGLPKIHKRAHLSKCF